jgi:putative transposase
MPRRPRLQVAGGVYHVTARGVRRQEIFWDAPHYQRLSLILTSVVQRCHWRCHGYCLMPNHYHLVVETPEPNISRGMQRLNGEYAQWFNDEHGFSGHLFQGRFYGGLVESTAHFLELARYLVLNPVRAGLCRDAGGWRWSSYTALVGDAIRPAFLTTDLLLEQFGREPDRAREAFRGFVRDAPERYHHP